MTILSLSEHGETLLASLKQQFQQITDKDPLQKVRAKAWDHFLELGLPTRRHEPFRYLRLRHFFSQAYVAAQLSQIDQDQLASYIYPECKHSVLVFVNGYYQPALSNITALSKKIVISPLRDAIRTYGTFLNNQWAKSLKEETDPFTAINSALHQEGLFIYLPPKCIEETPIQILHVVDTKEQPMLLMPRLHLFAGAQSQAKLITSTAVISGTSYGINQAADFAIEESANVQVIQSAYESTPEIWHFDAIRAHLKRDSRFLTVNATEGSATVRHDYRVALVGENAEASLNGVMMLSGKNEAHTHVLIDHQAPHCRSMQLFKTVLNDTSHSSFEGKILVQQAAQKTDAFQLNNNLLLSDHAHADSKPNLEIFADDVKASHGATVGQLDNEQLFYMKTRGFSDADAKNLLVYSFCKEVIDLISIPSLLKDLSIRAKRYVNKG